MITKQGAGKLLLLTLVILCVAITTGTFVSPFLFLLDKAIHFRFSHPWLLYLLPVGGLLTHFIYQSVGRSAEKGNDLIIEQIHQPSGAVPPQMAPVILVTTLLTHLFGGSAGREGTAVQIGGSIAAFFSTLVKVSAADLRIILIAGIAGGFSAVFGTPVAGAIFALEVLAIGRIDYKAIIPALSAAVIANLIVTAWSFSHLRYHIELSAIELSSLKGSPAYQLLLLVKIIVASAGFGLAAYLFSVLNHEVKVVCRKLFKHKWMIPVAGGLTVVALTLLLGRPDYLNLGVDAEYPGAVTISSAFKPGGAGPFSWLWKTIFTVLTIGTGFKGGEVTPLFYIGATLGNTISSLLHSPLGLFAALGFIGVFAGATNTPIASTILGVELFGGDYVLFFAVGCITSYVFSGHSGIYTAQKIVVPKFFGNRSDTSLAEAMTRRGYLHEKFKRYRF